ncbi:MAG: homoserine kinase [Solirubrobacterales bacterium]|jgi:homoserine kinase|nr:homoserine kinase [Solirubrobacterales bacterium]
MTARRRLVKVPASSANLGPGYDVLAAALAMHLELEVEEAGSFSVEAEGLGVPLDRSNLCVRAFESLRPADGIAFRIRSAIPLAAGLGSSAAAIVAGLLAADHLYELALEPEDVLVKAAELEGHPDNVAAALFGGFVVCSMADGALTCTRLDPPQGVEAVVVIPNEQVPTEEARKAVPEQVPVVDAVANISAATELVLGIQRSDLTLIGRGLSDRLHQPYRAHLYPRSMEIVEEAPRMGAIGATISGAGPTVLVWAFWQSTGEVMKALTDRVGDWAEVRRVPFSPMGADVPEL